MCKGGREYGFLRVRCGKVADKVGVVWIENPNGRSVSVEPRL